MRSFFNFLGVILIILTLRSYSQSYQIGEKLITLIDQSRTRNIECRMFYPALTSGADGTVAVGEFPLIIFGHGYLMSYSAYQNFIDKIVANGFIIAFPTTESGLSPSHIEFANDMKFVMSELKILMKTQQNFFLYGRYNGESAFMGHSMGGGASMLAAKNNNETTVVINFAAAETSESAINAAQYIQVPVFMFTGTNDGVTPLEQHQLPMYNNLQNSCRALIQIKGGGHCNFANFNLACYTAELTTSPQPVISREQQHQTLFSALLPLLEWMLKWDIQKENVFKTVISDNEIFQSMSYCEISSIHNISRELYIYPNPASEVVNIKRLSEGSFENFCIYNELGKLIIENFSIQDLISFSIDMSSFNQGIYFLVINTKDRSYQYKLLKL